MDSIDIIGAKKQLSKRVARIESGRDEEIVIARNGQPAARLVPIAQNQRVGLFKGQFQVPSLQQLDACNVDIARMFSGN